MARLAGLAAVVSALAMMLLAINAQATFLGSAPSLTETGAGCASLPSGEVCANLFANGDAMAPGGPAEVRAVALTLTGGGNHTEVGLHLQNFLSRGPASDDTCSAADPGSKFDFEVTVAGRVLYTGSLAGFAATYSGSARQLPIPGRSGGWARGDQVRVTLAVRLDASADNSYMGCTTDTDFVWLAA